MKLEELRALFRDPNRKRESEPEIDMDRFLKLAEEMGFFDAMVHAVKGAQDTANRMAMAVSGVRVGKKQALKEKVELEELKQMMREQFGIGK